MKVPSGMSPPLRSAPSFFLSLLIAFFPKCPICLAAYLSLLGTFGTVRLSSVGSIFYVLVGFLALHLLVLLRNTRNIGCGPFLLSLMGALTILGGRRYASSTEWLPIIGIGIILSGSLWNAFSLNRLARLRVQPATDPKQTVIHGIGAD